jgi:THO complex subunit 4
MIKAKPRQGRKGGRGGSRSASAGAPAPASGAGGARQRYASNVPNSNGNKNVNAKISQAAQKPLGGDAVKVIISNLPMDVTEAAVRVCSFLLFVQRIELIYRT